MRDDVDYVVLDGPLGWSDDYDPGTRVVELDGYMIDDLRSYREGLFESMLALFEDQTPMRIDAIRAAVETADFEHLRHQAHELAGGAAYVGAASLATHARAIETRAKEGDAEGIGPLVDALDDHATRTVAALRTILGATTGEKEP